MARVSIDGNGGSWANSSLWIPAEDWALIVAWNPPLLDVYDIKRKALDVLPEFTTDILIADHLIPSLKRTGWNIQTLRDRLEEERRRR